MTTNNDCNTSVSPSTLRAAIYTKHAVEQTRKTQPPEVDDLFALAQQHGFTREQVTLVEDCNTSGRRNRLHSEALTQLLREITDPQSPNEPIRAIFVSSEDRLFRDAAGITLTSFIQVCQVHGVTVITPHFAYDFREPSHADLFRLKCQQAYQFVTQMVVSRLQAGRKAAKQRREQGKKEN